MAGLVLKNLCKSYGNNAVVRDFSLEIQDKEFIVLVGPSGCGKTTTLRMIAGLEDITGGELYINGKLMNDVEPKDRDIAMVFQSYALYPHMTVYENMGFGLQLNKRPKAEIERRVREAASVLCIDHLLNRKPKELSGGQRQRVALGRAIVREPQVFLMDEPLSNLDANLRVQMRAEITKLRHRLGATVVYVTHDQTEAMTMGDRIVVMKDGIIQQVDKPLRLYNCPENMFVGRFIGSPSMNFVKARVTRHEDLLMLEHSCFCIPCPDYRREAIAPYINREIVLGIRPESIWDEPQFLDAHPQWCFAIDVDVVEPLGSESYLYFSLGSDTMIARAPASTTAQMHSKHHIAFDMDSCHLFDPESQQVVR